MSKKSEAKLSARAPRAESKEHKEAIKEAKKPNKYGAFHVRLTQDEVKRLKQKLLDLELTGTQWLRQFINS